MKNLGDYLEQFAGPQGLTGTAVTPRFIRENTPKQEDPEVPSFGEVFLDATVAGRLIDSSYRPREKDPNFEMTPDLLKQYAKNIPPEFIPDVADSESFEEFIYRIRSFENRFKVHEGIRSMGATGLAYQLGVSILDPAFLIAAPVAGAALGTKAVGAGVTALKTVRAQAALRGAGIGAAFDGSIEGIRYAIDPLTDGQDLVINVLGSTILGAGLGAAFPRTVGFQKSWKEQVRLERLRIAAEVEKSNIDDLMKAIGPENQKQLEEVATRRGIDIEGKDAGQIFRELVAAESRVGPGTVGPFLSEEGTTRYVNGLSQKELFAEAKARGIATTTQAGDTKSLDALEKQIKDQMNKQRRASRPFRSHDDVQGPDKAKLKGAKPKYSQASETTFGDDIDKSIFAGGKGLEPNPNQRLHRNFVMQSLGISEEEFITLRKDFLKANRAQYKKGQPIKLSRDLIEDGPSREPQEAVDVAGAKLKYESRQLLNKVAEKLGVSTYSIQRGRLELLTDEQLMDAVVSEIANQKKKATRKIPRSTKQLREEIIAARQKDFELDNQSVTAMISSFGDSGETLKNTLNMMNFTVEDYAKELNKRIPEESAASRYLNFIPFAKPMAVMAKRSKNERVQAFFSLLVEDPTGSPRLDIETILIANRKISKGAYNRARLAIRRSNGVEALRAFDEKIAEATRTGQVLEGLEGKAQAELRKYFNGLAEFAEESGIAGFRNFVNNNYIPRRALAGAVNDAIDKFGQEEVERLLVKALRDNNPDMSAKKLKATISGWFKYAQDPDGYTNARVSPRANSADKINAMRSVLERSGVNEEEVEEILEFFIPKSNDPHVGMTNKRINFNESASIEVEGVGTLKFSDLLVNDMDLLMERYSTRLLGAAELTKLTKALNIPISGTSGSVPTRTDILAWLKGGEGGLDESMETSFDVAYNAIMGMSQGHLNDKSRSALRFLQDLAFIQAMGNVGIAQMPEIANSTVSNGLRATLQSVPRLRNLIRQAHNGELSDEVLAELDAFIRPGDMLDEDFTRVYRIHDDMGLDEKGVSKQSKFMTGMRVVASGAPVTFAGRGFTLNPFAIGPMDEILRNGHVASTLQNWVNTAYSVRDGKKLQNNFWSKSRKRFEYLGFSEDETDELMKALSDDKVTIVEQGLLGKKIVKLNLSAMDDRLRNKLIFALRRDVDRVIQRNKIGNFSPWMSHPVANTMLQFRKFAINATNKQLVYNLQMNDGKTYATFLSTIALGALGYVITTEIGATKFSGKELKEYREQAYGPKEFLGVEIPNVFVGGVVRSGPFGSMAMMLSPISKIIDPEEQDLFNTYRTSGYGVSILNLENTPVGSIFSGGMKAVQELSAQGLFSITGGRLGNRLTEPELRQIFRLQPLRNTLFFNRLNLEIIEQLNLPERQK